MAIPIGGAGDHRRHQPTLAVDRGEFVADGDALGAGYDFLRHLHDLIPEKLAAHSIALQSAQELYKDAPLGIIGVDGVVDGAKPEGLLRHRQVDVR